MKKIKAYLVIVICSISIFVFANNAESKKRNSAISNNDIVTTTTNIGQFSSSDVRIAVTANPVYTFGGQLTLSGTNENYSISSSNYHPVVFYNIPEGTYTVSDISMSSCNGASKVFCNGQEIVNGSSVTFVAASGGSIQFQCN